MSNPTTDTTAGQASAPASPARKPSFSQRLLSLPPERRALLEEQLIEQGISLANLDILPRPPEMESMPLSFAQRRLWFLHQLEGGSSSYNLFSALRLTGPLRLAALHKAFSEMILRHEVLRTSFALEEGEPVQRVAAAERLPMPVIDLSRLRAPLGEPDQLRLTRRLTTAVAMRPFDLEEPRPVRVTLFRLAEGDHVLSQGMHHIVSDAWSLDLFSAELLTLYRVFSRSLSAPSPLPPLAIQYADFAVWQRKWLRGNILERQLGYWREQLGGGVPALELQADRRPGESSDRRGDAEYLDLPPETESALDPLCREEKATRSMLILAALQALLGRLTGQSDFAVGSAIANRNRREIEPLIGFFVNTRVLRADLRGNPTFRDLIRHCRELTLGADKFQDVPFERLVEEFAPERDADNMPFFQVAYNYLVGGPSEEQAADVARQDQLHAAVLGSDEREVPFNLTLQVRQSPGVTSIGLEYRRALYDAVRIERMLGGLVRLLSSGVAEPDRPLSSIGLLGEHEARQLVTELAVGRKALRDERSVPMQVVDWAQAHPGAVAMEREASASLTYGELLRRARAVAGTLRARAVGPEKVVAVLSDRSPDTLIAAFGIQLAGAAYLPLDRDHPTERNRYILEDAGAGMVLVEQGLEGALPADYPGEVLAIGEAARGEPLAALVEPDPHSLAYVIYTSGSTGRPKGVGVSHSSLGNLVDWYRGAYGCAATDRATLLAGPAFDASIFEIWPWLSAGATLCAPTLEERVDAEALTRWLEMQRITVTFLPTPMAEAFLTRRAKLREQGEAERLSLRLLLTGGDRLTMRPHRDETFPLINQYGPTENAVVATWGQVAPEGHGAPSIGKTITNGYLLLTDRYGQPALPGFPGELRIGGDSLARGYVGRPALTAEAFVPDPVSGLPGARLYRSGDLVRALDNGEIVFQGRIDHQVKVRGFRIELGEIDGQLNAHPAVAAAVTGARKVGDFSDKELVAFVVVEKGFELPVEDEPETVATEPAEEGSEESPEDDRFRRRLVPLLRAYLGDTLPGYMVPAAFVRLERMPLTPNGKVDRKALDAIDPSRLAKVATPYVAPSQPLEAELAAIWKEILEVERVGVLDNFFDLGGHSLLATQVVSKVRSELGLEAELRTIFEKPTVEQWAAELRAQQPIDPAFQVPPLVAMPRRPGETIPLSFAQQRLWFLHQLAPESGFYNIFIGFKLAGPLDARALGDTFTEILRRHESLRTTFPVDNGQPRQEVAPPARFIPAWIDLSGLAPALRDEAGVRLAQVELERPFDLAAGPLMRASLVHWSPEEHALLLNIHHIVADGWSIGVFYREMMTYYRYFRAGGPATLPPPLPEPEIQYPDYALWQRGWLAGERLEQEIDFWRQQLDGAPPALALPLDRPRPEVESFRERGTRSCCPQTSWPPPARWAKSST